jgi:hypothetical protein
MFFTFLCAGQYGTCGDPGGGRYSGGCFGHFVANVLRVRTEAAGYGQAKPWNAKTIFCEITLVVLATKYLPFNAFVVLHQLLLAYPGNVFFNIVAAIVCPPQDSDEPTLPNQRSILKQELMFLKELEGRQKQILAKLKRTDALLDEFEESLTGFKLPAHFSELNL